MEYVKGPDGMYYKYFTRSFNSKQAHEKCKQEGGYLVGYESQVGYDMNQNDFSPGVVSLIKIFSLANGCEYLSID